MQPKTNYKFIIVRSKLMESQLGQWQWQDMGDPTFSRCNCSKQKVPNKKKKEYKLLEATIK